MVEHRDLKRSVQTFLDAFISYLQAERNASPRTVQSYRADLEAYIRFLEAQGVAVAQADRSLVRQYLASLAHRGLAHASIARHFSTMRTFYRYLLREGVVPAHPMIALTRPKIAKRLPAFLSVDEAAELLETPVGPQKDKRHETLALRDQVSAKESLGDLLARVMATNTAAFDHQKLSG